jgi:hypothetical protein
MLAALTKSNEASCNNKQRDNKTLASQGLPTSPPHQPEKNNTLLPHLACKIDHDRIQILTQGMLHKQSA